MGNKTVGFLRRMTANCFVEKAQCDGLMGGGFAANAVNGQLKCRI